MYLGIDIGTSSVKAVLLDETDRIVDQASAPLPISRRHLGWSEQHPADWWSVTHRAVEALNGKYRSQVAGIGLSGQMHGAVLLDEADEVLRPAILWNDVRSDNECRELEAAEPASRRITGNIAMPGFTAPKLLWVRRHEPDTFAAVHSVLLPKDYIRLQMTGDKASDLSDAAGTLWVDVGQRRWSQEMLSATGLKEAQMPRLFEGPEITGSLRAEVAKRWKMQRVPVVAGAGDNAAGAIGIGVIRAGDAFLSLGTSGVIFVTTPSFAPNPERAVHAFCHGLPGLWHQMTVMLSAASCLDWAAQVTGCADAAALLKKVEQRGSLEGTEIFLPYLTGERTPHNDPFARGVLFGLNAASDATQIGQAVLEGVAFALADGLDALLETKALIGPISVIGGGARSAWWGQVIANVLARPLVYRDSAEVGPAHGAARLARLGVTGESVDDVCTAPPIRTVIEPRLSDIDRLAAKRARFSRLYRDLRSSFRES